MVFFKILPLLIVLIIFLIPFFAKKYLQFLFTKNKEEKNEEIIMCDKCGTYVHESLLIIKNGKNFCSENCLP